MSQHGQVQPTELPVVEFEFFSSSFCGACNTTRALLAQVQRLIPTALVREHNMADSPDLASQHDIDVTPTVIVRNAEGEEIMRAAGTPTIHQLIVAARQAMGL